jgi:hypothetical protein
MSLLATPASQESWERAHSATREIKINTVEFDNQGENKFKRFIRNLPGKKRMPLILTASHGSAEAYSKPWNRLSGEGALSTNIKNSLIRSI